MLFNGALYLADKNDIILATVLPEDKIYNYDHKHSVTNKCGYLPMIMVLKRCHGCLTGFIRLMVVHKNRIFWLSSPFNKFYHRGDKSYKVILVTPSSNIL